VSSFPLILSAPSGGGKTTIARELLRRRNDLGYSVSCTTRPPRPAERDGTDYFFLTREAFVSARGRGEFAESAEVHDDLYGTLRSEVEKVLASGRHVVMDIDVQGARQFIKAYPESVLVFVLPPDVAVLLERLKARGTESGKALDRRLGSAVEELIAVGMYHYVVVNEDIDRAVNDVSKIVDAEQMRTSRIARLGERVDQLVAGLEGALGNNQRSN
jgi:guanylate kinase